MTPDDIKKLLTHLELFRNRQCSARPCSKCEIFDCLVDYFQELSRQALIEKASQ